MAHKRSQSLHNVLCKAARRASFTLQRRCMQLESHDLVLRTMTTCKLQIRAARHWRVRPKTAHAAAHLGYKFDVDNSDAFDGAAVGSSKQPLINSSLVF